MRVRSQFGAYGAKTGKEVWKFWTTAGPGEIGNEIWERDSWKYDRRQSSPRESPAPRPE
jgi:hypothetical protein